MRWVWIIGGVVSATVALMALIGGMIPMQHHASRRALVSRSPEVVYAMLAGPPNWRRDISSFGALPDENGRKQWWEEDRHHRKIRYELLEERPPVRRVVRIADPDLPYGGTWTFDISPSAGGSEIRITENGEIYNVFFRFLARFVFGYNASIEGALRELGSAFGEQVKIEP